MPAAGVLSFQWKGEVRNFTRKAKGNGDAELERQNKRGDYTNGKVNGLIDSPIRRQRREEEVKEEETEIEECSKTST